LIHAYDKNCDRNGETLVVLHGLTAGATPFGRQLEHLHPHFGRIIAPEALGHGFSDSPDDLDPERLYDSIRELLNAELERPAIIYGNSMGGGIALRYATEHPEKVRALVMVSPAGARMPEDDYTAFVKRLIMDERSQARDFVNALFYKTPWYAGVISNFVYKRFNRPAIRSLLGRVSANWLLDPAQLANLSHAHDDALGTG
jgi:pimeloyl-ACP methyl ester carboxylesterase